ncbi:hypothetical protein [Flammeovirga kamogawensis]|uniref:Uncharacterized protein n=1 Tax=Flammeovirga kamogawensis TaxID=373891 RepID=A0ABX8GVM8_9BACT|nr:hypothetical protein [Flammeovirga kamogawensis]MBB6461673.1 hypothetical protein [Flammeovirga kamogawensis]QWG07401.1 hypothetical protein KM029_00210 [Flammeovirga kamogawensis]TRX69214.1 hypothetical protein EO216_14160 [Flammeovirga kamogawensis]
MLRIRYKFFTLLLLLLLGIQCNNPTIDPASITNIYFESTENIKIGIAGVDTTTMEVQILFEPNINKFKTIILAEVDLPTEFHATIGKSSNISVELEVHVTSSALNSDNDYSFIIEETENLNQLIHIISNEECIEMDNSSSPIGIRVEEIELIKWDSEKDKYYINVQFLEYLIEGATVEDVTIWQTNGVLNHPCD